MHKAMLNSQKSAEVIVCDLKVVILIAEMLLLLSRSIPIGKCLVRNERCEATETKREKWKPHLLYCEGKMYMINKCELL